MFTSPKYYEVGSTILFGVKYDNVKDDSWMIRILRD